MAASTSPVSGENVRLELVLDGRFFSCDAAGSVTLNSPRGRIRATCQSGEVVDCNAAPWDWVYDQQEKVVLARCVLNNDPGFIVEVNPATQAGSVGGSVTWQVRVRNTGPGSLTGVQIATTPATSGCNRTFTSLAAGGTISYTCAYMNIPGPLSIHFSGTATRSGSPVATSTTASITIDGAPPPGSGGYVSIHVCRGPATQIVTPGQAASWEIRVANAGTLAFGSVQIQDSVASNCGRTITSLQPGAEVVYGCTRSAAGEYRATLNFVAVEAEQGFTISDQFTVRVAYDPIFRGRFGTSPSGH